MSEPKKGKALAGRLFALGILAFAYEEFRPSGMPSLVELFTGKKSARDQKKEDEKKEAMERQRQRQKREVKRGDFAGIDMSAFDAYADRFRVMNEVRQAFDWWIDTFMVPACEQETTEATLEYVDSRKQFEWGVRSRVDMQPPDTERGHFVGNEAIDTLKEAVFLLEDQQREKSEELVALLESDWQQFVLGLRKTASGPLDHPFVVPYRCADTVGERGERAKEWPWGSDMSFSSLRDRTLFHYQIYLN